MPNHVDACVLSEVTAQRTLEYADGSQTDGGLDLEHASPQSEKKLVES